MADLRKQAEDLGLDTAKEVSDKELKQFIEDNKKTAKDVTREATPDATLTQDGTHNENGEKTNGTTKDGDTSPVEITDSVPQNGVKNIETSAEFQSNPADDVAKKADEARTAKELKFADESNPNQKARNAAAPEEFDQDGNERGGGYSYGVADDDVSGLSKDAVKANAGTKPEESETGRVRVEGNVELNKTDNYLDWSVEDQQKLEDEFSREEGVDARVITSAGNYVKIKFFLNNKPLGSYKSYNFNKAEAKKFLKELLANR